MIVFILPTKKKNWLPTAATFKKINRKHILYTNTYIIITHQSAFIVYKENRVSAAVACVADVALNQLAFSDQYCAVVC